MGKQKEGNGREGVCGNASKTNEIKNQSVPLGRGGSQGGKVGQGNQWGNKNFASLFAGGANKQGVGIFAALSQPAIEDKTPETHRGLPAIRLKEALVNQMNIVENHLLIGKFSKGRPTLEEIRKYFATNFFIERNYGSRLYRSKTCLIGLLTRRGLSGFFDERANIF